MASKFNTTAKVVKMKIRRPGRHSKRIKARDKKQTFFTQGASRGK